MIRGLVFWSVLVVAVSGIPASVIGHSGEQIASAITLQWDPNVDPPAGYLVYVGAQPDRYDAIYDVGNSTEFNYSTGVPGQRYYFAVAAYDPVPGNVGPMSEIVSTIIPGAPTTISLSPPRVEGAVVTLGWKNVGTPAIEEYFLEAGSASGLSNLFVGSAAQLTSLTASIAPGNYYVRLRGRTSTGQVVVSNEITFSAGVAECSAPPAIPTGVIASVTSGIARLQWIPVPGATSYYVLVGSSKGRSDLFVGNVGPSSQVAAQVPARFKALARVVGVNACGHSEPSSEVRVR